MPTPTVHSPNTGNYQIGKGILTFKKDGDADFRHMGNVSSIVMSPDVTTLDHYSSMAGTKSKDLSIVLERKMACKIVMDEITAANIALMMLGTADEDAVGGPTVDIFTANAVNGALHFVGTNDVGPKLMLDLYNVSFQPSGDFQLISNEFNEMEATADVLQATSGGNTGKFGLITITNTTGIS